MDRRLPVPRWRRRGIELKIAILLLLVFCYLLLPSSKSSLDSEDVSPKQTTSRTPLPPREGSASTLERLGVDPKSLKEAIKLEEPILKKAVEQPSLALGACGDGNRGGAGGVFLGQRIPLAARLALALPLVIGGAAILADEGKRIFGHGESVPE